MKSFFKQLGKALCYFILFLYSQSLIAVVYQFIYGFQAGVEAKMTGQEIDMQKFSEGVLAYINEKSTDIIVISGCLTMLTLWLFFLIRKKNVLTESGVSKFSLKYVPILVVLGIALQIVCSFGLSMLPAEILADYANNLNQKFGEISFVAIIAQVIAAPVVEEIIFRGLVLSRLRKGMPTVAAVIISSALFGLVHGQIMWMAYTFVIGILWAVVAIRTESILTTIILHMIFNASGVILSMLAVEISTVWYITLLVVGGIASAVCLYLLVRKPAVSHDTLCPTV